MSSLSQFFSSGSKDLYEVEIFAVGSGAGGRSFPAGPYPSPSFFASGGGGAGQCLYKKVLVTKGVEYPITIGAGGAVGSDGSSTIFGSLKIFGGNGNGGTADGIYTLASASGGDPVNQSLPIPSQILRYAVDYYLGISEGGTSASGGGGGGAVTAGAPGPGGFAFSALGGTGMTASLIGYPTIYVGGGGHGGYGPAPIPSAYPTTWGAGVPGGVGFISIPRTPTSSTDAIANTGGGGAGGGWSRNPNIAPNTPTPNLAIIPASNGGSGVLFVRYPTGFNAATVTGNTPTPAQPGYHVYRWNSGPASITFN